MRYNTRVACGLTRRASSRASAQRRENGSGVSKAKSVFVCEQCGHESPKWAGQCPACQSWNSLVESVQREAPPRGRGAGARASAAAPRARKLQDIAPTDLIRIPVSIGELHRVLGGGLVPGSAVLLSGDPGIGKSTLLLQFAIGLADAERPVLYVSGEESAAQIRLRASRLGLDPQELYVLAEIGLEDILDAIGQVRPGLVIIDSIQTLASAELSGVPGSIGQVRECASQLVALAKQTGVTLFLVGHVTKEGSVAGPKTLEHMVDTVLALAGDQHHNCRILKATKNRFGSTNEVGIFAMQERGMVEVPNPSAAFLAEREPNPGSAVAVPLEGSRPLLVEVQALVTYSPLAVPRRMANGCDQSRLHMLIAVLTKRAGLRLADQDVYVNVVGGLELDEPAVDLAICLAIASSAADVALPGDMVSIGEVGLAGELRSVFKLEERAQEAARRGYNRVLLPRASKLGALGGARPEFIRAESVRQAIRLALGTAPRAGRKEAGDTAHEGAGQGAEKAVAPQ